LQRSSQGKSLFREGLLTAVRLIPPYLLIANRGLSPA
jgi:hypothetical protein